MSITRYLIDGGASAENELPLPKLLYLTKSKFENDLASTMHFHPFAEILFITAGRGRVVIDTREINVAQGDLVIVNPDQLHTEYTSEASPLEYTILGVGNLTFDRLRPSEDDGYSQLPAFRFSHLYDKTLHYLDSIYTEIDKHGLYYPIVIQNMLTNFIIFILRNTGLVPLASENRIISKECSFVKQYLDSHYSLSINLSELAGKAYISEGYLIRSFKKYFGMSPICYLKHKRVKEASILLKTTDLSISKICAQAGFSTPSHFAETFKQVMGCTPYEYRNAPETDALSQSFSPPPP